MSRRNFEMYQQSISDEFKTVQDRVRNIIGDRHWGEEGRYKEIIFMNIIKRYLPKHLSVGSGFIISSNDQITSQIDVIIYDNRFPLIFSENDFVICSNQNVVGIVEIKTKVYLNQLEKIIDKAHSNGKLFGDHIFNGIFAFDNQFDLEDSNKASSIKLAEILKVKNCFINHISFGENLFIRYWDKDRSKFYSIYRIERFSFPYFISNLIESTYRKTMDDEKRSVSRIDFIINYLYGIEDGKENYKIRDILV